MYDFMVAIEFPYAAEIKDDNEALGLYAKSLELALYKTFGWFNASLEDKLLVLETCGIPYNIKVISETDPNSKGISTEIVRDFVYNDDPTIHKINVNTDRLIDTADDNNNKNNVRSIFDYDKKDNEHRKLIKSILDEIDHDGYTNTHDNDLNNDDNNTDDE